MTASAVHTPFVDSAGAPHGRLWRKEILRKGPIAYRGGTVDLNDELVGQIRAAFDEGALNQTPVQLADAQNTHTLDPERFRGDVVALEETPESLFALLSLSPEGDKAVRDNPRLGVSARIVQDHTRHDGKHFKAALEHVLMTLNPVLTGLKPWQEVTLANPDLPVVDLTSATYSQQGAPMDGPTLTAPPAADADEDLTEEEWEALMRSAAEYVEPDPAPEVATPPGPTSLALATGATAAAIELANSQVVAANARIAALEAENRRVAWEHERDAYVAAGTPPILVELAASVLNAPLDLAHGSPDYAGAVRKMLDATKGLIDFGVIGSSDQPTETDAAAAIADAFISQYGGF